MVNGDGLGGLIAAFVVVIVGVSLFISIADTIGSLTNTFTITNASFTASNNTAVAFAPGGQNVTTINEVRNGSTVLVLGTNFTQVIANSTITMNASYSASADNLSTELWNVDYSFQTNDFIDDSAARSITSLITIFFALALMAGALLAVNFKKFGFE